MSTLPTHAEGTGPRGRFAVVWLVLVPAILFAGLFVLRTWTNGRSTRDGAAPRSVAHAGAVADAGSPDAASGLATGALLEDPAAAWSVPDFALTERSGRVVKRADLDGRVWIANFVFTQCGSVCPVLSRTMASVRRELRAAGAAEVVSVSFSVDPLNDTPEVLGRYATDFGAAIDGESWLFLTGDPDAMLAVVKDGFRLPMADPRGGSPDHSDRFAVVDAKGRIRAIVPGLEEGAVERLVKDALALRAEGTS